MTTKHLTDQSFADLPLVDSLQRGLADAGFTLCTPIQAQTLPPALNGEDVAGQAQTGTGKTIAFLLACCNYLLTREPLEGHKTGQPRALILAPTRELAIQIHKDAEVLNKYSGLNIGLVYGGTGYDQQKAMLNEHTDILIGTPGRLIDFYKQKLFSLQYTQIVILDEADRMFDLGFIKDIRFLLRKMPSPENRLNLLYSATLSFRVMELAYEHMNDPCEIKIESDEVVADKVEEYSFYPADEEKLPLLVNLVKQSDQDRVLVFVNTRHAAERVSRTLEANDTKTAMLSGDVPQNKREKLLEEFKSGARRILVATDVAARGLHIPAVSHVYNFDLPQDPEDYVHRIGRTARAGASGEAVSFICEKYAYSIMDIEEFIGHSLPRRDIAEELLQPIERAKPQPGRDKRSRGKDGRGKGTRGRKSAGDNQPGQPRDSAERPRPDPKPKKRDVRDSGPEGNDRVATPPPQVMAAPEARPPENKENQAESPVENQVENNNEAAGAEARRPSIVPANPDLPPRFSRRFGEVPAIG